jgi:hypothetical protein
MPKFTHHDLHWSHGGKARPGVLSVCTDKRHTWLPHAFTGTTEPDALSTGTMTTKFKKQQKRRKWTEAGTVFPAEYLLEVDAEVARVCWTPLHLIVVVERADSQFGNV